MIASVKRVFVICFNVCVIWTNLTISELDREINLLLEMAVDGLMWPSISPWARKRKAVILLRSATRALAGWNPLLPALTAIAGVCVCVCMNDAVQDGTCPSPSLLLSGRRRCCIRMKRVSNRTKTEWNRKVKDKGKTDRAIEMHVE